jgi:hypothetical protein
VDGFIKSALAEKALPRLAAVPRKEIAHFTLSPVYPEVLLSQGFDDIRVIFESLSATALLGWLERRYAGSKCRS